MQTTPRAVQPPSPSTSSAEDVTIDQVIEAVADAITQLVVFSLEAEENNSILPSIIPGAQAVARTVDALVAIVDSMAAGFKDEPQIQQKMSQAGGIIRNATSQLVTAAQAIARNQFDQAAKKKLLELAKDLLQNTVRELHLTDKYEVFKIIKAANLCKGDVAKGRSSAISAEEVMSLARSLSANVVHLVQLVNKRVAHNIVDPTMKRRMVTANDTLKNNTKGLVVAMGEALKNPGQPERKQEQYRVARLLDQAIDEIIEVAKLSCKTMFDSLDFDLGTPSGSAQVFTDPSAGLRAAHAQLVEGFRELDDSAARRAAQEAAKALQKISEALNMARQMAENCDDPELRKRLLEAIAELERIQQQLVPLVKAALRGDKDALAKLQGLLDEARKYADTIAEIAAWQELAACARDVDAALDRLADAIKRGDRAAALEAKADVERGLKRELELLAELPQNIKDAYWKDRLAQIRARLAELLKAFPAIADAAIANPNNKKAVDDLANVSTKIKEAHVDLTNSFPGRWDKEREREAELERQRQRERERAAQERQAREKTGDAIVDAGNRVLDTLDSKEIDESTPEGRVYAASKRVAEDMKLLSAAANRGDKAEVIAIARRIAQHVRDIQTNCNEISTKCKDPRLREQVLGAAGAVSSITVQLKVITAVKAASDPNDPTIKAQLVKCAESLASNLVNTVNAVEIATIRY